MMMSWSHAGLRRVVLPLCWAGLAAAAFLIAGVVPQPGSAVTSGRPADPAIGGWSAVFSGAGREAKAVWATAALALAAGESPHPAIPAAGFTATFSGNVAIDRGGRYRFTIECEGGSGTLTIYDRTAKALGTAQGSVRGGQTAWIDLPAGEVSLSVKFTRRGDAPARLRTVWERAGIGEAGFVAEALPPAAVTVPPFARGDAATAVATAHGRALLSDLGCASCHDAGGAVQAPPGPNLGDIGSRASAAWLEKWLANPAALKPGTRMPRVLGDTPKDRADARAIVAFLTSVGGGAAWEAPATEPAGLARGRLLYHTVGCVACHGPLEPPAVVFSAKGEPADPAWTPPSAPEPFGDLRGKWRPRALAEFLADPLKTRPAGRMPSMALSSEEADFIATYLVSLWNPGAFQPPDRGLKGPAPAVVDAGRAAFAARGCASCHELGANRPAVASTLTAPGLANLDALKGCLDPKDANSPRYDISSADRSALAAALNAARGWPKELAAAPIDAAALTIDALGCRNCHERDGRGGPADGLKPYFRANVEADLGDEGRLPPRLTGVGAKLTTSYARDVLLSAARARPYMATRMPQFGEARVGTLAAALAETGGIFPDSDAREPEASNERVAAGRTLVGDKGMNCISCHTFGDAPPAGTPGPDITKFAARLRHGWFDAYIMDPQRFKPGTKMTAFYHTLDGKGTVKDVFGGEPAAQRDALWAYFTLGEFAPEPEGLPRAGGDGLAITIGDRPVVFRAFLKDAGSRGIAVGYPAAMGGLHFAFDAEACRLVDAWRGDFLDATGAWKNRGGQIVGGRGGVVWAAPGGPAIRVISAPDSLSAGPARFLGYSLDGQGVPTFRYAFGPVQVEECFKPEPGGGAVLRAFAVAGLTPGDAVWVSVGTGGTVVASGVAGREVDDEGTRWIAFTPDGGRAAFSLRIPVKEGTP
ncbi:MAG: c-type cytochrome [Phycisphaerales bacterium]|nr:c-type cytochrome [Phycisphaerales bacterium]